MIIIPLEGGLPGFSWGIHWKSQATLPSGGMSVQPSHKARGLAQRAAVARRFACGMLHDSSRCTISPTQVTPVRNRPESESVQKIKYSSPRWSLTGHSKTSTWPWDWTNCKPELFFSFCPKKCIFFAILPKKWAKNKCTLCGLGP